MYNIIDEVRSLNSLKMDLPIKQKLPNDNLLNEYEEKLGIKFSDDYRYFIKNIGDVIYNGLDNLSIDHNFEGNGNLLETALQARTIAVLEEWLPIVDDNADY